MKNVALLTFHTPINYGAALQSVALSKSIELLDASCTIIDYKNQVFEEQYSTLGAYKKPIIQHSAKGILWATITFPHRIRQKNGFRRFIKKNSKLTGSIHKREDLFELGEKFDIYITGSDQVWNLKCSGDETAYFLDFVKDKPRCSYAASFGDSGVNDSAKKIVSSLLSCFKYISVRESSGISIVKELTGKECVQTLDPTLLLNSSQWNEIVKGKGKKYSKPYLLIYFMAQSAEIRKEMMELAHRIADLNKYDIVIVGGSIHGEKNGIKYANPKSPEEFVSLFRDCSFVVTNSFHGTAFSVNYNKDFYSYVKPNLVVEGRVKSFLTTIGLQSRVFSYNTDITNITPVRYENANILLNNERNESLNFLRVVIND